MATVLTDIIRNCESMTQMERIEAVNQVVFDAVAHITSKMSDVQTKWPAGGCHAEPLDGLFVIDVPADMDDDQLDDAISDSIDTWLDEIEAANENDGIRIDPPSIWVEPGQLRVGIAGSIIVEGAEVVPGPEPDPEPEE